MRSTVLGAGVVALLSVGPVWSQGAATPVQEKPVQQLDPADVMRQMGAKEEDILRFQLLSQAMGGDAGPLLLLMMMGDGANGDKDLVGLMLLSKALSGGGKGPLALLNGNKLLIIEDGTVYSIDTTTLKVEGSVAYRPAQKTVGLPANLAPMLEQAKGKAQATACLSNMKQLCLAAMMYAQDWQQTLPSEEWPKQLEPYLKNRSVYQCPGAPDKTIAFALNEALAGAKLNDLPRPAETVLFYESSVGEDVPFGGPDAVLTESRHQGLITVGFADGHCKLMKPEEARKLLEQDPLK